MFTQLSQIISTASLSGLHLMLRPLGQGKIAIIVSCEKNGLEAKDVKLQEVLSNNLCIEGDVTDLDETFISSLVQYSEIFEIEKIKTNIGEITENVEEINSVQEAEVITQESEENLFNSDLEDIIDSETQTF